MSLLTNTLYILLFFSLLPFSNIFTYKFRFLSYNLSLPSSVASFLTRMANIMGCSGSKPSVTLSVAGRRILELLAKTAPQVIIIPFLLFLLSSIHFYTALFFFYSCLVLYCLNVTLCLVFSVVSFFFGIVSSLLYLAFLYYLLLSFTIFCFPSLSFSSLFFTFLYFTLLCFALLLRCSSVAVMFYCKNSAYSSTFLYSSSYICLFVTVVSTVAFFST